LSQENKQILALLISKKRKHVVVERFISKLVVTCGSHPVSTKRGWWWNLVSSSSSMQIPKTITSSLFLF
jgi:transposase-like protein